MGIGSYRGLVRVDGPGTPTSDDDGNYVQSWVPLVPAQLFVSIEPASPRDLERIAAGTVISTATHIIRGRDHSGVTTQTRVTKGPRLSDGSLATGSREFSVVGGPFRSTDRSSPKMVLVAVEIVQ